MGTLIGTGTGRVIYTVSQNGTSGALGDIPVMQPYATGGQCYIISPDGPQGCFFCSITTPVQPAVRAEGAAEPAAASAG
jgi:hypothetical protein